MSKLGSAFPGVSLLAAIPTAAAPLAATPAAAPAAAQAPHHIVQSAAWGCRHKRDVFDLLFMGLSASFDTKLADAVTDGSCVFFQSGETITIIERTGSHGLVKIQRGAEPAAYWTPVRNVD